MIKTFRGILSDGGQDRVRLSTKKGKVGYKIVKFEIMPNKPFTNNDEHILKVYKIKQTTIDGVVDLSDGNVLGVAIINNSSTGYSYPSVPTIIFEQEIFNQDIYVSHWSDTGSDLCNYYLELETMSMTDNAAAVSTLRDIRLNPQVGA